MQIALHELNMHLLAHSLGRAQLEDMGKGSGVRLDCDQSCGAGGRESPSWRFAEEVTALCRLE